MKKSLVTAAACLFCFLLTGEAMPVVPPHPAAMPAVGRQSGLQTEIRTFMGTITKAGDQFVFSDDATKALYQLDDQQTAGKFEGRKVRVTGTLDATNNMIRVQSIEAAA